MALIQIGESVEQGTDRKDRVCTLRALIAGVAGALCIGVGSIYIDMVIRGTRLAVWNLTPAATFLFFMLVAIVNVALRLIHPRLAFRRGELAVVYMLMLLANTLPGTGFSDRVLPAITGAYYYATPENNWREEVQPYLPAWPIPQGEEAIVGFYEGSSTGMVPWKDWALPLFHWLGFGLALFLVMVCLMVIVRRQWVEHERLLYPMVQLPLAMIGDDIGRTSRITPLFRSGLMWLGFAVPLAVGTVNAIHNYFGSVPAVNLVFGDFSLFQGTVSFAMNIKVTMLGFSYFIPQNVALGLIFFHLLNQVQLGIYSVLGWEQREAAMGIYSTYTDASIVHQSMGGMIVLVLGTLWMGRRHIAGVARKALCGDPSVDDSDEIMSYRTAVLGTLTGFLVMGVWLWRTGIPPVFVPLLLFAAFVLFITITRVVAQGGVASMYPPTNAPDFVISGVGASALGPKGVAGLALSYGWSVDNLILLMAACANGLKLITEVGLARRRRLIGGIVVTIALTLTASTCTALYLGYRDGAINSGGFYGHAHYPYWFMETNIHNPEGPNLNGWIHKGLGAAIMTGLMVVQHRWVWWPFHPVGYPISCVFRPMFFSVFLAWMIKTLILKYAGLGLFNRLKPFFLGLILGEAVVAGCWNFIDYFTGMQGNSLSVF